MSIDWIPYEVEETKIDYDAYRDAMAEKADAEMEDIDE